MRKILSALAISAGMAFPAVIEPVNPNASAKAKAVYAYLQNLKGQGILSGQESMLWDVSTPGNNNYSLSSPYSFRDHYVAGQAGGKFPAIYQSDFGDVNTSRVADRQRVVDIIKARAPKGTIFVLNWHTGPSNMPDGDGYGGAKTTAGAGQIIDSMLREGSVLNVEWYKRLDVIAGYLKQLRDANIVVLWRPFHENNGNFFWWGQQPRFKELWRQMYHRFTTYHNLDNLLWVYNSNHFGANDGDSKWVRRNYPGDSLVDIGSIDVYAEYYKFTKVMYDTISNVAAGKPVGIAECGKMPDVGTLFSQGQYYAFWVTWHGYEDSSAGANGNSAAQYTAAYGSAYSITEDEINYALAPMAISPRTKLSTAPAWSIRRAGANLLWSRSQALRGNGVLRLVGLDGQELSKVSVPAGAMSGSLKSPVTGVTFLVLESADAHEVQAVSVTH